MRKEKNDCPICGFQIDDNHFIPVSFPGIDEPICCNCDENLGLMFTNFEEKPGDDGYIVPDNSDQLEQLTGRPYIENRLLYFLDCLRQRQSQGYPTESEIIIKLRADIEKISLSIKKGNAQK